MMTVQELVLNQSRGVTGLESFLRVPRNEATSGL
jgi:hypothetical protein